MSKRRKIILGAVALILLSFLSVCIVCRRIEKKERSRGIERIDEKSSLEDILYYENGQGENPASCYIYYGKRRPFNMSLGGYVCLVDYKYKTRMFLVTDISRAIVDVYDMNQGKVIISMDIKELQEQYLPDATWEGYHPYIYMDEKGQKYVVADFIGNIVDYDIYDMGGRIYLNIETGEVGAIEPPLLYPEQFEKIGMSDPYELKERERARSKEIYILDDEEIGLLEKNGFKGTVASDTPGFLKGQIIVPAFYDIGGVICVRMAKSTLPKENKLLYTQFPGLKDYDGDDSETVEFYFGGYPTGEEILSMFLEEGQEISFEGCVLSAESSVDGKEHEINSFEDYYQWKKWDE